jgi:hypothetical protein
MNWLQRRDLMIDLYLKLGYALVDDPGYRAFKGNLDSQTLVFVNDIEGSDLPSDLEDGVRVTYLFKKGAGDWLEDHVETYLTSYSWLKMLPSELLYPFDYEKFT